MSKNIKIDDISIAKIEANQLQLIINTLINSFKNALELYSKDDNNDTSDDNNANLKSIFKAVKTYETLLELFPNNTDLTSIELKDLLNKAYNIIQTWKNSLIMGSLIDVYDTNIFYESKVVARNNDDLTIHFQGWPDKHNKTINIDNHLILPKNTVSKVYKQKQDKVKRSKYTIVTIQTDANNNIITTTNNDNNTTSNDIQTNIDDQTPLLISKSGRIIKAINKELTNNTGTSAGEPVPKKSGTVDRNPILFNGREIGTDRNESLCFLCGYENEPKGSEFLLCDGPCLRSFHMACLKAEKGKRGFQVQGIYIPCTAMYNL